MDTATYNETEFSWGKHKVTGDAESIAAVRAAIAKTQLINNAEAELRREIAMLREKVSAYETLDFSKGIPAELRRFLPGAR